MTANDPTLVPFASKLPVKMSAKPPPKFVTLRE